MSYNQDQEYPIASYSQTSYVYASTFFSLTTKSVNSSDHQRKQLQRMNTIHNLLKYPQHEDGKLYREYVSIFIYNRESSEYFLMYAKKYCRALCYHNFLQQLMNSVRVDILYVLECLNLLLANCYITSDLVYVLSQGAVHEFLFNRVDLLRESADAVEYYVQLLKAIIMRLSQPYTGNLIQLFCNNKYPMFPLLTNVAVLGITGKYVLTRVTARQCVLLLIRIINEKDVGIGYLCELQMGVFYFEIVREYAYGKDQYSTIKYLVDLVYVLRENQNALDMLLNCVCNWLVIRYLERPSSSLDFLLKFKYLLKDQQEDIEYLSTQIRFVMYRVLAKCSFCMYLNSSFHSAIYIINKLNPIPQPILFKVYHYHCQRNCDKIQSVNKGNPKQGVIKQYKILRYQWYRYNQCGYYYKSIHYLKHKDRNSGLFNSLWRIFNRADSEAEGYVYDVLKVLGFRLRANESLNNLYYCVSNYTATYLTYSLQYPLEKITKFGQSISDSDILDNHLNYYRKRFYLAPVYLYYVLRMLYMLKGYVNFNKEMKLGGRMEMKGYVYYCYHLKEYLTAALYEHLGVGNIPLTKKSIGNFGMVCLGLAVRPLQKCMDQLAKLFYYTGQSVGIMVFEKKGLREYLVADLEGRYLRREWLEEQVRKEEKEEKEQKEENRKYSYESFVNRSYELVLKPHKSYYIIHEQYQSYPIYQIHSSYIINETIIKNAPISPNSPKKRIRTIKKRRNRNYDYYYLHFQLIFLAFLKMFVSPHTSSLQTHFKTKWKYCYYYYNKIKTLATFKVYFKDYLCYLCILKLKARYGYNFVGNIVTDHDQLLYYFYIDFEKTRLISDYPSYVRVSGEFPPLKFINIEYATQFTNEIVRIFIYFNYMMKTAVLEYIEYSYPNKLFEKYEMYTHSEYSVMHTPTPGNYIY